MRLRVVAAVAFALLAGACINTGDAALDKALWNSWPLESIGHDEPGPNQIVIAALVHRGGLREDHDELAQRVTIDRLLRYAAKIAHERKATRFTINPDMRGAHYTARMAGVVVKNKVYPYIKAVVTFPEAGQPVPELTYVFDTNTVMSAPKEPLLALRSTP